MEASELKDQNLSELVARLKSIAEQQGSRKEVEYVKAQFYKILNEKRSVAQKEWIEQGNAESDFVYECAEESEFKSILEDYKKRRSEEQQKLAAQLQRAYETKKDVVEKLKKIVEQLSEAGSDTQFEQVKELQKIWREAGQVAPDKYGDLVQQYGRYMEQFYDYMKINHEMRDYDFKKNLDAKIALCERSEVLAANDNVNESFVALQGLHAEWREIGPVVREMRDEIWNRFKAASDIINKRHAKFYEDKKKSEAENLSKKISLCEAIESIDLTQIKSAKAWESVANKVTECRQEWKKIGFASKKDNAKVYERFSEACAKVGQARVAFFKEVKDVYTANISAKKELCAKAEELLKSEDVAKMVKQYKQLQNEWKSVGVTPRKLSDELWNRFKSAGDAIFESKKVADLRQKGSDVIRREKDKLIKAYEAAEKDIRNRENNLGFLKTSSKEESPIVTDLKNTIEKLKKEQEKLLVKIKEVEDKLNNAK